MADLGIYISHTTCELRWYFWAVFLSNVIGNCNAIDY